MPTSARLRHVGASPSSAATCRPHQVHTATLCTSLGIPGTLGIPTNKMNLSRLRSPHVSVFVFRLSEGWSAFFQTSCAGCISRLCKYVAIKRVEMAPSNVVTIEIPRVTFKMRTKLESRRLHSLFATHWFVCSLCPTKKALARVDNKLSLEYVPLLSEVRYI